MLTFKKSVITKLYLLLSFFLGTIWCRFFVPGKYPLQLEFVRITNFFCHSYGYNLLDVFLLGTIWCRFFVPGKYPLQVVFVSLTDLFCYLFKCYLVYHLN